jgi:hypothetical protein
MNPKDAAWLTVGGSFVLLLGIVYFIQWLNDRQYARAYADRKAAQARIAFHEDKRTALRLECAKYLDPHFKPTVPCIPRHVECACVTEAKDDLKPIPKPPRKKTRTPRTTTRKKRKET